MAELADALDSGSSELTLMQVQVLLSALRFNLRVFTLGFLFLYFLADASYFSHY